MNLTRPRNRIPAADKARAVTGDELRLLVQKCIDKGMIMPQIAAAIGIDRRQLNNLLAQGRAKYCYIYMLEDLSGHYLELEQGE